MSITQEQWEKACGRAKTECHGFQIPLAVSGPKKCNMCGVETEHFGTHYPPIGDPAAVLKMLECLIHKSWDLNFHDCGEVLFLEYARSADDDLLEFKGLNVAEAIMLAVLALPENQNND